MRARKKEDSISMKNIWTMNHSRMSTTSIYTVYTCVILSIWHGDAKPGQTRRYYKYTHGLNHFYMHCAVYLIEIKMKYRKLVVKLQGLISF